MFLGSYLSISYWLTGALVIVWTLMWCLCLSNTLHKFFSAYVYIFLALWYTLPLEIFHLYLFLFWFLLSLRLFCSNPAKLLILWFWSLNLLIFTCIIVGVKMMVKGLHNERHDWCFWRSLVSGSVLFSYAVPSFLHRALLAALPSCSGREQARARSGLTCRGYTSPSGAAVTVAAAFLQLPLAFVFTNQDTLTPIFPKLLSPTLFHSSHPPSLPPSFFSFLPLLSCFLPRLPLPLFCLPPSPPLHTHTLVSILCVLESVPGALGTHQWTRQTSPALVGLTLGFSSTALFVRLAVFELTFRHTTKRSRA